MAPRPGSKHDQLGVVKLLLEHGARPDARDLCGKSFLHYAMGPLNRFGDEIPLKMSNLVIAAAIAKGITPSLVDFQDRFGEVPLMPPIMTNRHDLLSFLCMEHNADVGIEDFTGTSPLSMTKNVGSMNDIIRTARNKQMHRKEMRSFCFACNKTEHKLLICSKCKVAAYCDAACQRGHWKIHKKVCIMPEEEDNYVLITPEKDRNNPNEVLTLNDKRYKVWKGPLPSGVKLQEEFDVKIQYAGGSTMLLYNKDRGIVVNIFQGQNCDVEKFNDVSRLIKNYEPGDRQKAYFRAVIKESGKLLVSTSQLFVRKW